MNAAAYETLPPVLIVDDDEDDRYLTERALASAHVRNPVLSFATGAALKDFLREREPEELPPSQLLIDVRLRDCNGFELAEWVRSHVEFEHVGIVMMSGAEPAQRWQMTSSLRVAYINKFPPRHVLGAILGFYCDTLETAHSYQPA